MGLPIFREPPETGKPPTISKKKGVTETSTARERSAIRRTRASSPLLVTRDGPRISAYTLHQEGRAFNQADAGHNEARAHWSRSAQAQRLAATRGQTRSPRAMVNGAAPQTVSRWRAGMSGESVGRSLNASGVGDTRADAGRNGSSDVDDFPADGSRPQSRRGLGQYQPVRSSHGLLGPVTESRRPLLRRAGYRSISHLPAIFRAREGNSPFRSILDPANDFNPSNGLGDRDRSLSPAESSDGVDQWDTFLSTITPDPHLPSASTSFTSSAAANGPSPSSFGPSQSSFSSASVDNRSGNASARSLRVPAPASLSTIEASNIPRSASLGASDAEGEPSSHADGHSRYQMFRGATTGNMDDVFSSMPHYYDCPHHRDRMQYPHHEARRVQHRAPLNSLTASVPYTRDLSEPGELSIARYAAQETSEEEEDREDLRSIQGASNRMVNMRERLAALSSSMQRPSPYRQDRQASRRERGEDLEARVSVWASRPPQVDSGRFGREQPNQRNAITAEAESSRPADAIHQSLEGAASNTTESEQRDSQLTWPLGERM